MGRDRRRPQISKKRPDSFGLKARELSAKEMAVKGTQFEHSGRAGRKVREWTGYVTATDPSRTSLTIRAKSDAE